MKKVLIYSRLRNELLLFLTKKYTQELGDINRLFASLKFWHNDIQHNDTQHNDTQHNDTQHNDIQHNDTQHNYA